jgi:hypothetical protein
VQDIAQASTIRLVTICLTAGTPAPGVIPTAKLEGYSDDDTPSPSDSLDYTARSSLPYDYSTLRMHELRSHLRRRSLYVTGNKSVLVGRLHDADLKDNGYTRNLSRASALRDKSTSSSGTDSSTVDLLLA